MLVKIKVAQIKPAGKVKQAFPVTIIIYSICIYTFGCPFLNRQSHQSTCGGVGGGGGREEAALDKAAGSSGGGVDKRARAAGGGEEGLTYFIKNIYTISFTVLSLR